MTPTYSRIRQPFFARLLAGLVAAGLVLAAATASAAPTITFVQVNSATPHGSQVTVTVTFPSAQSAGNLNVVAIGWGDTTRSVVSVTDSRGNTYAPAVGLTRNTAGGLSHTIYYAKNIVAAPAGGNTVTVTFDGAATFPDLRILEYSGADLNTPVDVTSTATGSGTTSTTPAVTTTSAADLLFAADVVSTVNKAAGTGFTKRIISGDGNIAEDRMVTAVGSYTATATLSSGQWVAQMVAFRAAPAVVDTTPPSAPGAPAPTPISSTQINLTWPAATDNVSVTGYFVERCAGVGCTTFAQVGAPTTTAYSDTGLTAGVTYNYRVRATDAAGNLGPYSAVATAVTPAPDTTPPTAPSTLTATPAGGTQMNLAWTASTDNVAVTGYRVERCSGIGCTTFVQIATPTSTSYSDTGLSGGTSYSYRVRATDAAGNLGPYSPVATGQTADATPPTAPGAPVPTVISSSQINLTWTVATDNVGVTGYFVERCAGVGCATFAQIGAPTTNAYSDTGLSGGVTYNYRVRATDAAANLGPYSAVVSAATVDTTAPTAPSNLAATPVSTTQVNVSWTASTDNVGVTGYRVERCTGVGCSSFTEVAAPTGTSLSDTGLTAGISYSYRVRAVDAASNFSGYSSTATALTPTANGTISFVQVKSANPDTTQTTVSATFTTAQLAGDLNVVVVGWGDTTRSVASVKDTSNNTYVPAIAVTRNTTGGLSETIYFAKNIAGAAAGANTVTVTFDGGAVYPDLKILEYSGADTSLPVDVTSGGSGSGTTSTTPTVTTTNAADLLFAANVVSTVNTAPGAGFTSRIITIDGNIAEDRMVTTAGSYNATATLNSGQWVAQLVAFRAAPPAPDTTPPTTPANLTAAAGVVALINLNWTASADASGVAGYAIERCSGTGCSNFAQIATIVGTTFNDNGLTTSTPYSYRVRATDNVGNVSAYSNIASATTPAVQNNPVVVENQQAGTTEWQIGDFVGRPLSTDTTGTTGEMKGYASAVSVNKGQPITFNISVNPAQTYTIDVYRLGWYQGTGGRLMQHVGPLNGIAQPSCPVNASTGLIECNWAPSYTLATQTSWTSGVYVAVLRNAHNFYNYIVFTVRDDSRVGALMFQQSVTTDQAYNNYPDPVGKSLYEFNSAGGNTIAGTTRAVKVSFDRPYAGDGAGALMSLGAVNFIRWAEMSGYDITYSTDVDTHTNGERLLNQLAFLSMPHDEYWSKPMYDAATAARDAGVNLGFFGANAVFWQVRFEASSTGVPNRVMVCYKSATVDPTTDPSLKTVEWRDTPVVRPEQGLVGVQYTSETDNPTWAPYVVTNSSNWVYAGTGLRDGDSVAGIVGYEADRMFTDIPLPPSVAGTYTLLSHSPYGLFGGGKDYSNSSVYEAASGAWVFASGTMAWNWALDNYYPSGPNAVVDSRIQKTTANILNRFSGR